MSDLGRRILLDCRMESYEGYLPDDWSSVVRSTVSGMPRLRELLNDLMTSWRSAACIAGSPAIAIKAMRSVANGMSQFSSPDSSVLAYSQEIIRRLCNKMPEVAENGNLRSKIISELVTIGAEMRDALAQQTSDTCRNRFGAGSCKWNRSN